MIKGTNVQRRTFLKGGGAALFGATLASLMGGRKLQADEVRVAAVPKDSPVTKAPVAKAKKLIQIFCYGGIPQTETFDPHPENIGRTAPNGMPYMGPDYAKAIATNVPGIQVSESLPFLAKMADKYALLRSMRNNENGDHGLAHYQQTTGCLLSTDIARPTCTASAALKLANPTQPVPPYIFLTKPVFVFTDAGFLGSRYAPYATGGDPSKPDFSSGLTFPASMTPEHAQARFELLQTVNALKDERFQQAVAYQKQVYQQLQDGGRTSFDLSKEKPEVRERYGMNWFGQSALLARRLVEADNGAKVIKISWTGEDGTFGCWDCHGSEGAYKAQRHLVPSLDRGLSALLEDLAQRGLLDETIVLVGGEMGRDPRCVFKGGERGHWCYCYSWLVAGGGFKGGHVIGKSNDIGYATERPVYPWDLWGSVFQLLGIDVTDKLPHPQGCDVRVLPPPPTVLEWYRGSMQGLDGAKRDKNQPPEVYVTPFLKPDLRVTGGLLTEIM